MSPQNPAPPGARRRNFQTRQSRSDQPHRQNCAVSYAVLGPTDYLDIFKAPGTDDATKVATIIRTFGHASTEVWCATEWERFLELVRYLPPAVA